MPRVVIFSTAYLPLIGGAEIAVKELTDRLVDFEFVLITARIKPELLPEEKIGRVKVIRVGSGKWFDKILLWRYGWKIAEREGKFDLNWGIMASYGGLAALRYKKKRANVPFLLTLQEGDSRRRIYMRAGIVWPWFKQIFKRADFIQPISNYLADWARELHATCPVEVVPNGVGFLNIENKKENELAQKIILSVSRLVEKNGMEDLIKSMVLLPEEYFLRIIGGGQLYDHLEKVIKDLHLENRVTLIGQIPNQELVKYYREADLFVRPSLSEGLGNVFLEAMMLDVPVIGTKVGGIPDFLVDGKSGWFCNVADPEDVARKIKYVFDVKNRNEVERVKRYAKKIVLDNYSWSVVVEKMQNIFSLLKTRLTVVLATGVFPPEIGGPATYAAGLAAEWKKCDVAFSVVTYGQIEKDELPVFRVKRSKNIINRYYCYMRALWKKSRHADIIYAFDLFSTGIPALFVGKILRKPVLIRVGGDFLWEKAFNAGWTSMTLTEYYKHNLTRWIEKLFLVLTKIGLNQSHGIIFSSKWLKEIYQLKFGKVNKNILVIENPFPDVKPVSKAQNFDVVFVGRFIALKNIKTLLQAVQGSNYSVALIGDGPDHLYLEDLISELNLKKQVKLISKISPEEVRCLIAASRVVVLPSWSEVSPNTVLECIVLNKPILCTRETGYTDRFKDKILFFDPSQPVSLRESLDGLLQNSVAYEAYVENIKTIQRQPHFADVAQIHVDLFKNFLV